MLSQHFKSYPVRRHLKKPDHDNFGRRLPPLPTNPILTPQYQYRANSFLELLPHAFDSEETLLVEITKPYKLEFGSFNQAFRCRILQGPESLCHEELVALAFDPLYIDTFDLRPVIRECTTLVFAPSDMSVAPSSTHVARPPSPQSSASSTTFATLPPSPVSSITYSYSTEMSKSVSGSSLFGQTRVEETSSKRLPPTRSWTHVFEHNPFRSEKWVLYPRLISSK
jgi:hypothetical protein